MLSVEEDILNAFKFVFRHIRHRSPERNIVRRKRITGRDIDSLNVSKLATTDVSNNVAVTGSEVVVVLVGAVGRVEEFKDIVALDIDWLDVDQLVVGPLFNIRMRGSVIREVNTVAVPHLTEDDISG